MNVIYLIFRIYFQYFSGESAFHSMMSGFGWAKHPLVRRIDKLDPNLPITLMYGSRSWVDHSAADILQEKKVGSYFKLQVGLLNILVEFEFINMQVFFH